MIGSPVLTSLGVWSRFRQHLLGPGENFKVLRGPLDVQITSFEVRGQFVIDFGINFKKGEASFSVKDDGL